mmetsp:Transcript_402/g.584  ORF Transcript_402/g.584 Transcript_402/m.584 type:complete len:210 (+) Transcript_402:336-965(+)
MNVKDAAKSLYDYALSKKVKFPKIWDEAKLIQTCGATLLVYRTPEGFDINKGFADLESKFGVEEDDGEKADDGEKEDDGEKKDVVGAKQQSPSAKSKRSRKAKVLSDDEKDEVSPKKTKKSETMVEEKNRKVAEAIKEMADIYFRNKDMRKGGVFSKAAKAIRESEIHISTKKEAMTLKGVGKGIAGYIEEFLNSGKIDKLEELRAGTA